MLVINLIYSQSKDWVNLFLKLGKYPFSDGYQNSKVTPYIHIMVYHVPTFIDKYKSIKQFSSQGSYIDKQIMHFMHVGWTFIFSGIEKNNDVAKTIYFKNSNKWDAAADILGNQHRLSQLRDCTRRKRNYE